MPGAGWDGRYLSAALLSTALWTQACVSVSPWRACESPCRQLEKASKVEVCKTDGVPLVFDRARWQEDEHGAFISGEASTRFGQPLGKVKVYAGEIDRIWTQRFEGSRLGANVALFPLAFLFKAVTHEEAGDLDPSENEPRECPRPSSSTPSQR
jgi:hypothetical protein